MIKILNFADMTAEEVFARNEPTADVSGIVADIIKDVRQNGDEAVIRYAARFDGIDPDSFVLELSDEEKAEALEKLSETDPGFTGILKKAAANIVKFHSRQVREGFAINDTPGVTIGQKVLPLERAGLYVPGGTAAYPSTVLMDSIPALIAGCSEIIMVTPPDADGSINPAIIAAAAAAQETVPGAGRIRIFKTGGAQAIAALAYGTESIPAVDKIVGPGNAFVAEAKHQVYGKVSIDMIAGPSEILVVSDGKSDPDVVAADMLSQAEHDKNASAVLVTDSTELALAVAGSIEDQLCRLEREEIARASIERNGKIIIAESIRQAIDISNRIAPEHLELCVDDPFEWLDSVKHAGSVFLGRNCPEALGDYFAGPNHTLPTSGTARFSNPLSVDDFVKKMQFTYYTGEALGDVADDIAAFACKEGLTGHARSVLIRKEKEDRKTMSRFLSSKFAGLEPYTPGEQPKTQVLTKLNTNESPFPPMPDIIEAIREEAEKLQLYPDPDSTELRKEIARVQGVDPDEVICNNGSDETLYFAFMAYCDSGKPAVFPQLTYGFYPVFADITGISYREIPLKEDLSIDPSDYYDAEGTIFIANPNAPTGIPLSRDQIEDILKHNPDNVVVIDEAYVDFGTESAVPLVKKYDNLLVAQTFSKSRSMAGMRLGYGIGSKEIIADLNALRYSTNPYNIDRLAIAAGIASLRHDDVNRQHCRMVMDNREYTVNELSKLGFEMTDSTANFIFVRHPEVRGEVIFRKLRERGVIIRHWDKPEISDYNRITIGSRVQMDILIDEVRKVLAEELRSI